MTTILTRGGLLAAATALALTMGACSSDGDAEDADPGSSAEANGTPGPGAEAGRGEPFGAGCALVPAEGEGSFASMADDPVATAAGNIPALSMLVQAVVAANLVDTLNSTDDITVLAPADPAFESIPDDQLQAVLADTPQLTALLTHHVLEGRLAPDELAGTHTTLAGDEVTIEGADESFTVAGVGTGTPASVICGNVQTANATVYLLDQVLAPEPR